MIVPANSASISFISFMASTMQRAWPGRMLLPTSTTDLYPADGLSSFAPIEDSYRRLHKAAMILTAHALLAGNAAPTREEIVEAISGNLCRCTGYAQIVEAIALATERMRGLNRPAGLP